MAPLTQRRFDDEDDDGPYDPRYPGRKVVADGGRVTVPVFLTDGMPDWMPPRRPLYDAANARPRYAEISDAANRRAVESYEEYKQRLCDAWRGPAAQPPPDDDGDGGESPRDAYVRRLGTAYRTPFGSNSGGADAIEAQRHRWNAETPAKDAALADRDVAYGEYLDYLQNAWKGPPCGAVGGGRR